MSRAAGPASEEVTVILTKGAPPVTVQDGADAGAGAVGEDDAGGAECDGVTAVGAVGAAGWAGADVVATPAAAGVVLAAVGVVPAVVALAVVFTVALVVLPGTAVPVPVPGCDAAGLDPEAGAEDGPTE